MKLIFPLLLLLGSTNLLLADCVYGEIVQTKDYAVGVLLSWTTDEETDNDRFLVEFSTDGLRFQNVGSVPGNGTSQRINRYQYLHSNPRAVQLFYRLKQVNEDGTFAYTDVVVHQKKQAPQPIALLRIGTTNSDDRLTLTCDAYTPGETSYTIQNLDGATMTTGTQTVGVVGIFELHIPLEALPIGSYRVLLAHQETPCTELTFRRLPAGSEEERRDVPVARKNE